MSGQRKESETKPLGETLDEWMARTEGLPYSRSVRRMAYALKEPLDVVQVKVNRVRAVRP